MATQNIQVPDFLEPVHPEETRKKFTIHLIDSEVENREIIL